MNLSRCLPNVGNSCVEVCVAHNAIQQVCAYDPLTQLNILTIAPDVTKQHYPCVRVQPQGPFLKYNPYTSHQLPNAALCGCSGKRNEINYLTKQRCGTLREGDSGPQEKNSYKLT
jgi:hypothetical protein